MFWVEFGVENWPNKESFGVDFTSRGKHIPKQEDMFGCHVLDPKILRPPLCAQQPQCLFRNMVETKDWKRQLPNSGVDHRA